MAILKSGMISKNKQAVFLLAVIFLPVLIRAIYIRRADMPTGDEINTYIWYAQLLVGTGRIPPLHDHPMVAICYAPVIMLLRFWGICLGGVWASYIFFTLLGALGALGVYQGLKHIAGSWTSMITAVLYGCNPSIFFLSPRGDIGLFLALVPWYTLLCVRGVVDRKRLYALIGGSLGGVLWLSRSDGMSLIIGLLLTLFLLFARSWRNIAWIIPGVLLVMGSYQAAYRYQSGAWSPPPSQRAWDAFYQAEGLHDGLGGSWQDFSERGKTRFGMPDRYHGSFARMIWENRRAIYDRALRNLSLFGLYHKEALGISVWLVIPIIPGIVFWALRQKVFVAWLLPVFLTSGPILLFYLQKSYFIMLSSFWCIAVVLGTRGWYDLMKKLLSNKRSISCSFVSVCFSRAGLFSFLILLMFLAWRSHAGVPESRGPLAWRRIAPVLCELERRVRPDRLPYVTPKFGGSHAIEIYIDSPSADGGYGLLHPEPGQDVIIERLRSRNVRYLVALRERPNSWHFNCDDLETVFVNRYRNAALKRFDWNAVPGEN